MRAVSTHVLCLAVCACGAVLFSPAASATGIGPVSAWNFNLPLPSGNPTNFEIYLPGDQTGVATDYFNQFTGDSSGVSATYDSGTNTTTMSFSGTGGTLGSLPHFGFSGVIPGQLGGVEGILPPVPMEWSGASGGPIPVPVVGFQFTSYGAAPDPVDYFILQINTEFPDADVGSNDGDEVTNWYEMPYQGSYSYSLTPSDGEVVVGGAQYFTSDTQIPLDSLNASLNPSTYGANWTPLSQYTNDTLIPEPASLALVSVGMAGLGLIRVGSRKRR